MPNPRLIAHRGASKTAPENTLAAIEAAWTAGADGAEVDVRLSADGRVLCMHDETTDRTTDARMVVSDTPYSRLAMLDAGSWKSPAYRGEMIPTLGSILAALPRDRELCVEIKSGPQTVAMITQVLRLYKAPVDRVTIISFDREVLAAAQRLAPEYRRFLIVDASEDQAADAAWLDELINDARKLDVVGLDISRTMARPDIISRILHEAFLLRVWTVDDADTATVLAHQGVHYLTTNAPEILRNALSDEEETG